MRAEFTMTIERLRFAACLAGLIAVALTLQGCAIAGFGGAMVENYRRNSTKSIEPEYRGLEGKTWAVVVSADRSVQGEYPDIVPWLSAKVTERLVQQQNEIGAAQYIPAEQVLAWQYETPRWVAMARSDLARALGADRLIFIELVEYRLNEPGNQYLWEGLATGSVGVYEVDGPAADELVFQKAIRVSFPDASGIGPAQMPGALVATELGRRFVDRASWLFYKHEEPYYPKY